MPQFIQQFGSLPWAAILTAVVTVATGIHVAALSLSLKWPVFLKIASVSGALAIDVQKIIGWVGGAPVYTSIAAKKAGKAMVDDPVDTKKTVAGASAIFSVFVCTMLLLLFPVSCSSFLHFSSPATQAVVCDIAAPEMPIIESAAGVCGVFAPACLSALESLFGDACTTAAAAGKTQEEAHQAGLEAVNAHALKMKAALIKAGVQTP